MRETLNQRSRLEIENSLLQWIRSLPAPLHLHDRSTKQINPYDFRVRHLHVPYFVTLIILAHQSQPKQSPSGSAVIAAAFVSGILEEYLDWGDIAYVSPATIFYTFVAALVQISSHRFTPFASSAAAEQKVVEQTLGELKGRYKTAFGAERAIQNVIKLSHASGEASTIVRLSLPVEQRVQFEPFGPELCSQWHNVFSIVEGDETAATPYVHGVVGTMSGPHQQPFDLRLGTSLTTPNHDAIWSDGTSHMVGDGHVDTAFLLDDLMAADTVGRWWWSNWITQ